MRVVLNCQQTFEITSHCRPVRFDLLEQSDGLAVILATRALAEHFTARCIGCRNSCQDRECGGHAVGCQLIVVFTDELSNIQECFRLYQTCAGVLGPALLDPPGGTWAHRSTTCHWQLLQRNLQIGPSEVDGITQEGIN